jgi:hypothetical protein
MEPGQQFEEELNHLKSLVNKSTGPGLTFAVKIYRILEFVKHHPDACEITGLIWTKLPAIFLVNNQLLTVFLGIKCNSINTNFREHGFEIVKK